MIAALYVDVGGIYAGRPDVDPWDAARDARLYAGPWPVVAHPPCEAWGRYAKPTPASKARGPLVGDDGGCFAAALAAVERWGGVLEHPAASKAWAVFGLPPPPPAGGWMRSLYRPGWACHVEQGHYGHRAQKPTWLYCCGDSIPLPLRWGPATVAPIGNGHARGNIERMGRRERRATPPEFAALLLDLARSARRVPVDGAIPLPVP